MYIVINNLKCKKVYLRYFIVYRYTAYKTITVLSKHIYLFIIKYQKFNVYISLHLIKVG